MILSSASFVLLLIPLTGGIGNNFSFAIVLQGVPSEEILNELHESLASPGSPYHLLPHLLEVSTSSPMGSSWITGHDRLRNDLLTIG